MTSQPTEDPLTPEERARFSQAADEVMAAEPTLPARNPDCTCATAKLAGGWLGPLCDSCADLQHAEIAEMIATDPLLQSGGDKWVAYTNALIMEQEGVPLEEALERRFQKLVTLEREARRAREAKYHAAP